MRKKKFMPERERCFIVKVTLSGPEVEDKERLEAAAKNSAGEKEEQNDE